MNKTYDVARIHAHNKLRFRLLRLRRWGGMLLILLGLLALAANVAPKQNRGSIHRRVTSQQAPVTLEICKPYSAKGFTTHSGMRGDQP